MHRIGLGQHHGNQRVARLVIGSITALFFRHDHALALRTHHDLVFGALEVFHFNHARTAASGEQSGFVNQIGQIGAGESGSTSRQNVGPDIGAHGNLAHVHLQNLLATADIRQRDIDLPVKAAGAQQSRVENIGPVGRCDHDHPEIGFEAVHLHQHLVEGLLALIVAAAQTGTAMAAHGVDFVDEDDARRMLFRVLEHVAHTSRAHADEHFDEVRTRDGEKRYFCFTRNTLGQQRLAGARRADKQHPTRNAPAEFLEFLRVFEKVHQFLHVFLGLVATGDVSKGYVVARFIEQAGLGLAEAERTATATALHLAHEVHPDADQQQHREPGNEDLRQERLFLARGADDIHTVFHQVAHHPQVAGRGEIETTPFRGRNVENTALVHDDFFDAPGFRVLHELGVAHGICGLLGTIELLEHREQYKTDHQPDRNFGKPLIIQNQPPETGQAQMQDM